MGRDKSLSDDYPSIIINGRKYHYGREPNYGQYLVESATYAKDYWCFNEQEDLLAFLINLPESANHRERIAATYPDWHEVTPEQRDAYLADDRARQRSLAQEKVNSGTAPSFDMDLDGKAGPHVPQRLPTPVQENPLDRVEQHFRKHQGYRTSSLSEAGRLRMIEGEIDWSGVSVADHEAVLAREIDFARISPEQFRFVYEDIAHDKLEPADPAAAQKLFDQAHARPVNPPIRDTTRNMLEAIWLDTWPRAGAIVDFGIDSQQHYEALYYPVREGEITPEALDAAMGNGAKLTELARKAASNPHRDIAFSTSWDALRGDHEGSSAESPMPTDAQIAATLDHLRDVVGRRYVEGDGDLCSCWFQPEGGGRVGMTVFQGVPVGVPEPFDSLPGKAKGELLITYVSWEGFSDEQRVDVTKRVLDGQEPQSWMGGVRPAMPADGSGPHKAAHFEAGVRLTPADLAEASAASEPEPDHSQGRKR